MEIVYFKDGTKGNIIQRLNIGHKTIRPPYHLKGAFVVKGINFIGTVTVLPKGMNPIYGGEVCYSSVSYIKNK